MVTSLFDCRKLALLCLLMLLAALAVNLALLHNPAQSAWWDLDKDAGGLRPRSDCGDMFWKVFLVQGQPPCVVNGTRAQPVEKEAARRVIEEEGQNGHWRGPEREWLAAVEEKISEILEAIQRSWSMD